MEKFIVLGNEGTEKTKFEYEIGEIIRVNSADSYKCINKKVVGGKLYQFFSKGRVVFD